MLLLFNSLCRRALRPFISSTSGQRKRVYTDSSIALPSWTDCDTVRAPPSVHTPDLSWKCVGVPSLCWDQKCPSASCGFSSWEVFISNRAWTPLIWLAAWHVRGYFVLIPAMNAKRGPSLGPAPHTQKSHLSLCDFHFHWCLLRSLFHQLSFFSPLEIITRHVRRPVGGVVTLPLKFLIV